MLRNLFSSSRVYSGTGARVKDSYSTRNWIQSPR